MKGGQRAPPLRQSRQELWNAAVREQRSDGLNGPCAGSAGGHGRTTRMFRTPPQGPGGAPDLHRGRTRCGFRSSRRTPTTSGTQAPDRWWAARRDGSSSTAALRSACRRPSVDHSPGATSGSAACASLAAPHACRKETLRAQTVQPTHASCGSWNRAGTGLDRQESHGLDLCCTCHIRNVITLRYSSTNTKASCKPGVATREDST